MNRKSYNVCGEGNMGKINLLIASNELDYNEGLIGACNSGNIQVAELMMKLGATTISIGFINACTGDHFDLAVILAKKMRISIYQSISLFNYACNHGKINLLEFLCKSTSVFMNLGKHNFNEAFKNANYLSNMDWINRASHVNVVNFLFKIGVDINWTHLTNLNIKNLIRVIVYSKDIECSKLLSTPILYYTSIVTLKDVFITNKAKSDIIYKYNKQLKRNPSNTENLNFFVFLQQYAYAKFDKQKIELLTDYSNNMLWKPNYERHESFPKKIRNQIYHLICSIQFVAKSSSLNMKIPKPLIWIIINMFLL